MPERGMPLEMRGAMPNRIFYSNFNHGFKREGRGGGIK